MISLHFSPMKYRKKENSEEVIPEGKYYRIAKISVEMMDRLETLFATKF